MGLTERDLQAIQHLRDALDSGRHWYLALLEAIRLWESPHEERDGIEYRYLIGGEAFDWLLLAERITDEVRERIPEDELIGLLFFDRPPLDISKDEFKRLIGPSKYQAYLNYLYGVLVEESLILAVVDEVRKEQHVRGVSNSDGILDEAYRRVYETTQEELLGLFRKEKGYARLKSTSMQELKEFTYWLFKHRIKRSDQARVASDTKKALGRLHGVMVARGKG